MVKLWGPMLSGLATGLQNYQQGQEDLSYTRQARAQELQKGQLANQASEMQNQAAATQLQQAEQVNSYYKGAMASLDTNSPQGAQAYPAVSPGGVDPSQAGQSAASRAAPSGSLDPGETVVEGNFKPVGPMSMDQLAALDKKYDQPIGTTYGIMHAESNGKEDTVSQKGATGLFQVMPATAANPGYGLKAFNPKDPDGAMGYYAAMTKKAGGDQSKALSYWNAGPGGNPNNPETKAFIPKVQQGAQQFAAAYQLDQSKKQPTPAQQIAARDAAGVNTPVTAYQQASQAQARQIQALTRAGDAAAKDGNVTLAQQFYGQAEKMQDQQLTLQKKSLDTQKEANEQTSKLAVGVNDQSSYENFQSQIKQNPAMQAATAGLHLTGDYNQDRNKITTLADRTLTLKDQADMKLKKDEFNLKQQTAERKQKKEDDAKVQYQNVQVADSNRRDAVVASGLPYVPSIQATLPPGTPPAVAQKAVKAVQDAQIKYQTTNTAGLNSNRQVMDLSTKLVGLLTNKANPLETGGFLSRNSERYASWKASGSGPQAAAAQEFDKVANNMVTNALLANKAAGATGAGAFTAAMYDRAKTQKPDRASVSKETNVKIASEYYNVSAYQANKETFMNEFMSANPGALPQIGELRWAAYEQSLGPASLLDKDFPGGYRVNNHGVPKLMNGQSNPHYQDYHDFFRNNPYDASSASTVQPEPTPSPEPVNVQVQVNQ